MKHFHENHFYSWAIFIRMGAEIKVDYNTYELHEHDDSSQFWNIFVYVNVVLLLKYFTIFNTMLLFFFGRTENFFNGKHKHNIVYSPNKWSKSEFSEALFRIIGLHFCFSIDLLWEFGNSWFTKWTIFNFMLIYYRIYPPLLDSRGVVWYGCRFIIAVQYFYIWIVGLKKYKGPF